MGVNDRDQAPATPSEGAESRTGRAGGAARQVAWRWLRRALLFTAAVTAALFVTFFSVDLGPALRQRAERAASDYLERPMHIGTLKALVWPGRFEVDDVVIEGVSKTDQPFFTARKIIVTLTWETLLHWSKPELFVDVAMTDWHLTIETWPGRPSSMPKLTPRNARNGPGRFTTTVHVVANRGQFGYFDHGTPWSVVTPKLDFELSRDESLHTYVGKAASRGRRRPDSELPADERDAHDQLHAGRRPRAPASHRPRHRRGPFDALGRRVPQSMAGTDLSGGLASELLEDARAVLRERVVAGDRRGSVPRHLSHSARRRPRAPRRLQQRPGHARHAGDAARLSAPARVAPLAARPLHGHRCER